MSHHESDKMTEGVGGVERLQIEELQPVAEDGNLAAVEASGEGQTPSEISESEKCATHAAGGRPDAETVEEQIRECFSICSLTETGSYHLSGEHAGKGNQDACGQTLRQYGIVTVVSDGCGSTPDSKTGSSTAVRIVLKVAKKLLASGELPRTPEEFAKMLEVQLLERIKAIAKLMAVDDDPDQILYQSFLFTVHIGVVTPEWSAVIGCGDGFIGVNGTIQELEAGRGNQPDYITYGLFSRGTEEFGRLSLRVLKSVDTLQLDSLLIATDGIAPIAEVQRRGFTLSDLWKNEKYLEPEVTRETFKGLANDIQVIEKHPSTGADRARIERGLFGDDATLVVVVRKPGSVLPPSWTEYRRSRALESVCEDESTARPEPMRGNEAVIGSVVSESEFEKPDLVGVPLLSEKSPPSFRVSRLGVNEVVQPPDISDEGEAEQRAVLGSRRTCEPCRLKVISRGKDAVVLAWRAIVWFFCTPIRFPRSTTRNSSVRSNDYRYKRNKRR